MGLVRDAPVSSASLWNESESLNDWLRFSWCFRNQALSHDDHVWITAHRHDIDCTLYASDSFPWCFNACQVLSLILSHVCDCTCDADPACVCRPSFEFDLHHACGFSPSDEDHKPLKGSRTPSSGTVKRDGSDDSLVDYGDSGDTQFNEDGSFIGQYSGKSAHDSSVPPSPVNAMNSFVWDPLIHEPRFGLLQTKRADLDASRRTINRAVFTIAHYHTTAVCTIMQSSSYQAKI